MNPQTIPLSPGDTISVAMSPDGSGGMLTITSAPPVETKPTPPAPVASLFSAQSPWNSRPVKPVLGADTVPAAKQTPWIEEGAYGSKIFVASVDDRPMTITVTDMANQLGGATVAILHFPAGVIPATGQDGHCEVLEGDILHSFHDLRQGGGKWSAGKYARTSARGAGFGTVSNPDNVRAAGCSTAGGLLLASERGMDIVPHALAIGMDKNGIAPGPVYPATLEDIAGGYSGKFPMGSLMMLPPTFDAEALGTPELRTIARTLKKYGGILVDATVGSMNIYAEIGSKWANGSDADLQKIKAALRRVVSQSGWLDGDGAAFTPTPFAAMNLLSMRGPWEGYNGSKAFGRYDGASDLFQAEATTDAQTVRQILYASGGALFAWKGNKGWKVDPEPGVMYRVTAIGEGDISATIVMGKSNSGKLAPGKSALFVWPTNDGFAQVFVDKPAGPAASVRLELVKA